MADKSLPDPLSGEEIIVDLAAQIADTLRRDSRLSRNLAYERYGARVRIHLYAEDLGERTEVQVDAKLGEPIPDGAEEEVIDLDVTPAPPNAVRERSEQEVPVLTRSATGKPAIKRVRYASKKPKASPKHSNSARPGPSAPGTEGI